MIVDYGDPTGPGDARRSAARLVRLRPPPVDPEAVVVAWLFGLRATAVPPPPRAEYRFPRWKWVVPARHHARFRGLSRSRFDHFEDLHRVLADFVRKLPPGQRAALLSHPGPDAEGERA